MIIPINKPIGKTPLEICEEYKKKNKNIKKCSYAGRLDPMAYGLMIILANESCLKQNEFHNLSKIYEFKIALGISTDTYDLLGIVKDTNFKNIFDILNIKNEIIKNFTGKINQKYPPYSSIRIKGKPLWYYAKNNILKDIKIPEKEINIEKLDFINNYILKYDEFISIINQRIKSINKKYDFRQEQILKIWNNLNISKDINILHFRANVSCGTYIRTLVNDISNYLNIPMTTFEIKRISVGEFKLED